MAVDTIARGMAAEALSGGGSSGTASGTSYDPSTSGLSATNVQAAIDELANEKQESITVGSITLSSTWSGSGPYTQTITVTGPAVTSNSQVSLQPTAAQIAALMEDGVYAIVVENNAGTLTAYAVGGAPSAAITVQCTVTEVTT